MREGKKTDFHRTADGLSMYYELYRGENPDQPVVVFLNGLSQSTQSWLGVTSGLPENTGYLCLDLVHQGKSDEASEFRSYDAHSADVIGLCDALDLKRVYLCGISYGGAVAQHLLVNYPGRFSGAVLAATFAHKTELFNAIGESWKSALSAGGYPLMLDVMLPLVLGDSYFRNPLIPIPMLKAMRVANEISVSRLLKLMQATEEREDYRCKLKAIQEPVLILHGAEDLLITEEISGELHRNIPGSKLQIVESAGHTLNLEAIPQLTDAVKRILGI
ncbi:MAG: alpha/beta hydrolase [Bacteroidia bacterium]|nr:alpha/beta hydrolase [Bacteroidia bacterium]